MRHALKEMTAFTVLFLAISMAGHSYLMEGFRARTTGDFGDWNRIVNGRINADILVTGASRAQCGVDVLTLEDYFKKKCFNLALKGNSLSIQVARLKVYLKHNKAPEAIIQVVGRNMLRKPRAYNPGQFVPYLNEEEIYRPLSRISKHFILARYVPLYSFALLSPAFTVDAWQGLTGQEDPPQCNNGYCPVDMAWNRKSDIATVKKLYPHGIVDQITPEGKEAFEDLIRLCREKHIRLILVYAPGYYEFNDFVVNYREAKNLYHQYAQQYGLPLLDYSSAGITRQEDMFFNSQHLNYKGATRFSEELARDLGPILGPEGAGTDISEGKILTESP
jgi:hypothetical protein